MTTKKNTDTVEGMFNAGKEQMETAMQAGAQTAKKSFEQTVENTRKQFEEVTKNYGDFASFGRENVEAYVAASTAAAKGMEKLNAELFQYSKGLYEANLAAYKSLAGVKSPKEFFEINSELTKSQYEGAVSEVNKFNELASSVAKEVAAPINARVTVAAEQFSKGIA
ncbi:MAG: TIGR01841 family phasin [Sphingomonadales bacterium]